MFKEKLVSDTATHWAGEVKSNETRNTGVLREGLWVVPKKAGGFKFHRVLSVMLPLAPRKPLCELQKDTDFGRRRLEPGHLRWRKGLPWISVSTHQLICTWSPDFSGISQSPLGRVTEEDFSSGCALMPSPPQCRNCRNSAFVIYKQLYIM